jgi:hypothetical protein
VEVEVAVEGIWMQLEIEKSYIATSVMLSGITTSTGWNVLLVKDRLLK